MACANKPVAEISVRTRATPKRVRRINICLLIVNVNMGVTSPVSEQSIVNIRQPEVLYEKREICSGEIPLAVDKWNLNLGRTKKSSSACTRPRCSALTSPPLRRRTFRRSLYRPPPKPLTVGPPDRPSAAAVFLISLSHRVWQENSRRFCKWLICREIKGCIQ